MRRSLRHELHFCLEAFEARVMRAFAGALWREWRLLPMAYIHDALLLPRQLESSDVQRVFANVALQFDRIRLHLQVESWHEALEQA